MGVELKQLDERARRLERENPAAWRFFQDVVVPAVFGNTLWLLLQIVFIEGWARRQSPGFFPG
jgi:hypothetical protein